MVDDGSGFKDIGGSFGEMYNRNANQGGTTATVAAIVELNAGDKIKVQAARVSGSGNLILLGGGSGLTLAKFRGQKGDPGNANVAIQDNNVTVVSQVGTINFGSNLSVTNDGSGKVTIDVPNDTDELVKVSANDTTSDYLVNKITGSGLITVAEQNDGSNESLNITAAVDASDVTFSPNNNSNWDGSIDPGDVDNALDQLAGRVDDIEDELDGYNVEIQDNNSTVVSAVNIINFGTDLDVTDDGGGKVTVTPSFDANVLTYTPDDGTDWSKAGGPSVDPGNVNDALDQLADRKDFAQITTDGYGNVTADGYGDSVQFISPDGSVLFDGYNSPNKIHFRVGELSSSNIAAVLSVQTITSTSTVTTTAGSYVDMPDMSFVASDPGAYWVVYSGDLENSSNKDVYIVITINDGVDTQITHTERQVSLSSNKRQTFQTQGLISNVQAGDEIKIQWYNTGGTASSFHRSIILLRIVEV